MSCLFFDLKWKRNKTADCQNAACQSGKRANIAQRNIMTGTFLFAARNAYFVTTEMVLPESVTLSHVTSEQKKLRNQTRHYAYL